MPTIGASAGIRSIGGAAAPWCFAICNVRCRCVDAALYVSRRCLTQLAMFEMFVDPQNLPSMIIITSRAGKKRETLVYRQL
jgi:hypothetical protein